MKLKCSECDFRSIRLYRYIKHKNSHLKYKHNSYPYISTDMWYDLSNIKIMNKKDFYQLSEQNKPCIIFVLTELFNEVLDILLVLKYKYILITTSHGVTGVPYKEYPCIKNSKVDLLLDNSNMYQWYCKNPYIIHEKIYPLPLGSKWQWSSCEFHGENKAYQFQLLEYYNPKQIFYSQKKKNLVYINFDVNTTNHTPYKKHTNIRKNIYSILEKNKFIQSSRVSFDEYLQELSTYKFSISPPGKGIDTHRAWESLLVGTIPIVQSSPIDKVFSNLPVLVVNDWSIITNEYLNSQYDKLISKNYDFDKIYADYWIKQINNAFKQIL
jgi:hypothetical protein